MALGPAPSRRAIARKLLPAVPSLPICPRETLLSMIQVFGPDLQTISVLGLIVLQSALLGPMMKAFVFLQPGKLFKFLEFFRACFRVAQFTIELGQRVVRLRGTGVRLDRRQEFSLRSFRFVLTAITFSEQHVNL